MIKITNSFRCMNCKTEEMTREGIKFHLLSVHQIDASKDTFVKEQTLHVDFSNGYSSCFNLTCRDVVIQQLTHAEHVTNEGVPSQNA